MRTVVGILGFWLVACSAGVVAADADWTTYRVSETGTSVEIPTSIFTEDAGKSPHAYGRRFRSADGSADLTVESAPNLSGQSPAAFLASQNPPAHIVYKRITRRFFVVSSFRRDKIWYDRCNFSNGFVHCILLKYPADQKLQWDAIVSRISHSLSG